MIKTHEAGETVVIWAYVKNKATGEYMDPTSGVNVWLRYPDGGIPQKGSVDITEMAMTKDVVGKYKFQYTTLDADPLKKWKFWCQAVDGAGASETKTTAKHVFMLRSPHQFN